MAIGDYSDPAVKPQERTSVIGLGNDFRSDDGAGRVTARMVRTMVTNDIRVIEESGEGASLMEAWRDQDLVILIDAVQSGAAPGTIHRFDARAEEIPSRFFHYSTHAFSVAEAVELARTLGELPPQLIVYGIEGENFTSGEALSPPVAAATEEVARRVKGELCTKCPSSMT